MFINVKVYCPFNMFYYFLNMIYNTCIWMNTTFAYPVFLMLQIIKKETKNVRKGNIIDFVLVLLVHMHITSYQYFDGLCYIILPPPPPLLLDISSCCQGKHIALFATDERKREREKINTRVLDT